MSRSKNATGSAKTPAKKPKRSKVAGLAWRMLAGGAAIAAAATTRKVVERSWRAAMHQPPPSKPESPEVSWAQAVGWAALSGTAVALARLIATRQVAAAWHRAAGILPPGLETDELEENQEQA